jgi:hypothetical protein
MSNISTLIDKLLNNIDLEYLKSIQYKLPYWNFYYLVCLAEVLYQIDNDEKEFESEDAALRYAINRASVLYNTVNISDVFNDIEL